MLTKDFQSPNSETEIKNALTYYYKYVVEQLKAFNYLLHGALKNIGISVTELIDLDKLDKTIKTSPSSFYVL